jgi:hypothetical protein
MRVLETSAAAVAALLIALCPCGALAQPAPATAASVAEGHFFAGQKLYDDKQYEQALVEFRASYAAVPSPNSHLYLARCYRQMGRVAAAYEEYAQVILESADKIGADRRYESTQKAASEERAALKPRIATLVIAVPADAAGVRLVVGADEVPPAKYGQEIAVEAGAVTVHAEAPGRAPFDARVQVDAGSTQRVAVALAPVAPAGPLEPPAPPPPPPAEPPPSSSHGFLVPLGGAVAGVGVVGLVVWGALGVQASSLYSQLQKQCQGRCPAQDQSQVDHGRAETTGSQAGLAIGVLGLAGGAAILGAWFGLRGGARASGSGTPVLAVRIAPSPAGPGIVLGGVF